MPPVPLTLIGIDEAGYGPLLGPLCIGMAAVRVESWNPGDPAPDLWKILSSAVCKKGNDKRSRVAIDDSKRLKLANDSATRHPLTHLDRGIHACLRDARGGGPPRTWLCWNRWAPQPSRMRGTPAPRSPLPASGTPEQMDIAANLLVRGLSASWGNRLSMRRCARTRPRPRPAPSGWGLTSGTRGSASPRKRRPATGFGWCAIARGAAPTTNPLWFRSSRARACRSWNKSLSAAATNFRAGGRSMSVIFQPEAESAYLPVALASMAAKLTRETLMARFNRHWCSMLPELKPTAGYTEDGRRWLRDAKPVLTQSLRDQLIRIA